MGKHPLKISYALSFSKCPKSRVLTSKETKGMPNSISHLSSKPMISLRDLKNFNFNYFAVKLLK